MSSGDDELRARIKRVQKRSGRDMPLGAPGGAALGARLGASAGAARPGRRRVAAEETDPNAAVGAILRPQLALVLGLLAMIAGRAFVMNSLMFEPSTDVLGPVEGGVVFAFVAGLGLLFFRSDLIAVGALVVGAALGFLLEGYFIPLLPELMSTLYSPEYVGLVILNGS